MHAQQSWGDTGKAPACQSHLGTDGWPEWARPLQGRGGLADVTPVIKGARWLSCTFQILGALVAWGALVVLLHSLYGPRPCGPLSSGLMDCRWPEAELDGAPAWTGNWTLALISALRRPRRRFFCDWTKGNGTLKSRGRNSTGIKLLLPGGPPEMLMPTVPQEPHPSSNLGRRGALPSVNSLTASSRAGTSGLVIAAGCDPPDESAGVPATGLTERKGVPRPARLCAGVDHLPHPLQPPRYLQGSAATSWRPQGLPAAVLGGETCSPGSSQ